MKSLIVGGGKIGYYLLKTLKERNQKVTLIELDQGTCSEIADDLNADIIFGDGTDTDVLSDAGIEEAEIVAAVTGSDEENLVICQIAKVQFNVKKTIARINNPKNIHMFKALGVDKTVCSTEVIANLIEWEFEKDNVKIVQTFERGAMILAETVVNSDSIWCDKHVKELELPDECVIVSILRENQVVYPRGNTKIVNGDRVLVVLNSHVMPEFRKRLNRSIGGKPNERNHKKS